MSYILFKECELPSAQATSPPGLNRTFWLLTRPLSTWTSGPGDGGLSLTSACCPKVQLTGTRGWCLAQAHDLCPFLNFPVPLHFGKSRDNCFPHHEHGTPVHYNLFGYGDFFFFFLVYVWVLIWYYKWKPFTALWCACSLTIGHPLFLSQKRTLAGVLFFIFSLWGC